VAILDNRDRIGDHVGWSSPLRQAVLTAGDNRRRASLESARTEMAHATIAVGLSPSLALHFDPAGRPPRAVDARLVLARTPSSPRAALSQQALAIIECLGVQKTGDGRPIDQVTKSALAVLQARRPGRSSLPLLLQLFDLWGFGNKVTTYQSGRDRLRVPDQSQRR
jgi:hypothetical protein